MEIGLSFDDVLIEPQLGVVDSRSEVDLTTWLGPYRLSVPILSAPMSSVTDGRMAKSMFDAGAIGVIHRSMPIDDQVSEYLKAGEAMCAIGIHDGKQRMEELANVGCTSFVLDVAHAHTLRVLKFVSSLDLTGLELFVGSVATPQAVKDYEHLGIAGLRVGIGPGAACVTREVTGAGVPQLTAIMRCAEVAQEYGLQVIADGGIRSSGDIMKAIVAGADAVMLGRLLAGADEAPGNGSYYGMASERAMEEFGKEGIVAEGIEGQVEKTGPVYKTIEKLASGMRSGVSYSGASTLSGIRGRDSLFIRTTQNTLSESKARILN